MLLADMKIEPLETSLTYPSKEAEAVMLFTLVAAANEILAATPPITACTSPDWVKVTFSVPNGVVTIKVNSSWVGGKVASRYEWFPQLLHP